MCIFELSLYIVKGLKMKRRAKISVELQQICHGPSMVQDHIQGTAGTGHSSCKADTVFILSLERCFLLFYNNSFNTFKNENIIFLV